MSIIQMLFDTFEMGVEVCLHVQFHAIMNPIYPHDLTTDGGDMWPRPKRFVGRFKLTF